MKVSKWSFEILEGPPEPTYVYEAPVRFWHWTQALAFFVLVGSGLLIGWPLPANYAETWKEYLFGHILLVHFIAGMIFTMLFLYRIYWSWVGNKYSRMIFYVPFWCGRWWKGMWGTATYYLFCNKHPPSFIGHNPLAQTAMCLMYVLGSFLIIITGLGLYAQQWGWDTGWMWWFGWVTEWMGGAQPVRTFHHLLMYYLLLFFSFHLYMSFREDIMGEDTQLSTITNGIRYFKRDKAEWKGDAEAIIKECDTKGTQLYEATVFKEKEAHLDALKAAAEAAEKGRAEPAPVPPSTPVANAKQAPASPGAPAKA